MKRLAILLLGAAVLSGSGMPLRLPCCSLRKLAATAVQSDCCPIPGCTLAEKEGAAPATIEGASHAVEGLAAALAIVAVPANRSEVGRVPGAALSPSPPRGRPPSSALLSVYRI